MRGYLNGGTWSLIGEFTEIESGKRDERPELEKALTICKRQKAKLVIAKLDRLSRNLAFIATLMDSGVEFVAVDNPHANKAHRSHPCGCSAARTGDDRTAHQRSRCKPQRLAVLSSAIRSLLTSAIAPLPASKPMLIASPKTSRRSSVRYNPPAPHRIAALRGR